MDDRDDVTTNEPEREEAAHPLNKQAVARIMEAVDTDDRDRLWQEMEPLHAADIADLLEQLGSGDRRSLIGLYAHEFDGEILSELDESIREEVIGLLTPEVLADAVRELDSDDVVDLVEDLQDRQQETILSALEAGDRLAVQQSLTYPEYSAGRLMQREVVIAPEHWTVGDAIDFMRGAETLPEQFYHIILVDPRLHPLGNVTLGRIMASPRAAALKDLVDEGFHVIPVTRAEGDVAYMFNQYHLISAPVVDEEGRVVGVITIDDAMTVLDEENEEDIFRLAGVGEGGVNDSVIQTSKQRLPWLGVNLVTAILASLVISIFESAIGQLVALAVLMPIVASMGGNAGTQSLTVTVRALATKDLTTANVRRVLMREIVVGLINGLVFAVVMGIVGVIWFGGPELGYVIAAAMVINLVVAGFAGSGIPVVMDRMGIDPALGSGTFVTTVTDVIGFFAFLGLGALVLL